MAWAKIADRQFPHSGRQPADFDLRREYLYLPEYEHRARAVVCAPTDHQSRRPAWLHPGAAGARPVVERRLLLEPLHLATYTFDPANSLVLAAGGNFAHTAKVTTTTPFFQTTAVPLFQSNETLFTLSYTYNSAPWTVTPYFQFTHVPQDVRDWRILLSIDN